MKSPPDPLDRLLDEIHPPASESLVPEVWRRLAACHDSESRQSLGLRTWREAIEAIFRQPAFAVAFVIACTLLGLFLAEVRVSRVHAQRDVQLAQSYLRLIDPLVAGSMPTVAAGQTPKKAPPS